MAQRLCAILASTSAGMLNSFVPRTTHMALPTAVSRVTGVVTLLVVHNLVRARCGRWSGRLGGRRATRGWYGDTPGGSRAACGGGQLRLWILRRAARHLAHERRRSLGSDC